MVPTGWGHQSRSHVQKLLSPITQEWVVITYVADPKQKLYPCSQSVARLQFIGVISALSQVHLQSYPLALTETNS